tara:strand:+ start:959 stop:1453 length:495 start_codon:yes stop_codon:yes gene_type:complete
LTTTTTTAVRYHETGGPEVLRVEEVDVPEPGPGQALVRHAAIGVNYRDIYYRVGNLSAELPAVIGVECLQHLGSLAFYGSASGMPAPLDLNRLSANGIWVTRAGLPIHVATREALEARAREFFGLVADGTIKIEIGQSYPLIEAAQAHRDLEGRLTTGSSILVP